MSDVDCIRRFMEMAMGDVRCFDVMKDGSMRWLV